jgi:hypothetical protein
MLLLIAGYGLAAIAFYAYIYLTAQPDPNDLTSTAGEEPLAAVAEPLSTAAAHCRASPATGVASGLKKC